MPFPRRRFRRRFTRRFGKRREPQWIASAYNQDVPPNVVSSSLFQLVGPEDYTADYFTEAQRTDRTLLARTVGGFLVTPALPPAGEGLETTIVGVKAAMFVAGDKQVDDGFAADPSQFNIISTAQFPLFCRDYHPMHIWWFHTAQFSRQVTSPTEFVPSWVPPGETMRREWDITVKRRLMGDDALFLLIVTSIAQQPEGDFGAIIDVESRQLVLE